MLSKEEITIMSQSIDPKAVLYFFRTSNSMQLNNRISIPKY